MPKKKIRAPKSGPVWKRTAEQATLDRMPKFNAHACGTGAHGDAKYNRARQKSIWQREMNQEGTHTRGFLPFLGDIGAIPLSSPTELLGDYKGAAPMSPTPPYSAHRYDTPKPTSTARASARSNWSA